MGNSTWSAVSITAETPCSRSHRAAQGDRSCPPRRGRQPREHGASATRTRRGGPVAILTLLLLAAGATQAQPRHLETLEVALSGVAPLGEAYDGLWAISPGGALRVGTEFYGGQASFTLHAFSNEATEADRPDFLAFHGTLGWGGRVHLPARLRLTAGGSVGALHMRFDDDALMGNALANEMELTAGLFARLDAPLAGPVRLFAGAEVARVYTAVPITYRFVQGGVSVSAPAPGWLRRLLR